MYSRLYISYDVIFYLTVIVELVLYRSDERLCNFTVGLTHTQPTKTNGPDKSPHQECLFYSGAFPATRLTLTCNKPTWGRYLFIQINASQHVLTLCEVEVYCKCLRYLAIIVLWPRGG